MLRSHQKRPAAIHFQCTLATISEARVVSIEGLEWHDEVELRQSVAKLDFKIVNNCYQARAKSSCWTENLKILLMNYLNPVKISHGNAGFLGLYVTRRTDRPHVSIANMQSHVEWCWSSNVMLINRATTGDKIAFCLSAAFYCQSPRFWLSEMENFQCLQAHQHWDFMEAWGWSLKSCCILTSKAGHFLLYEW